MFNLKPKESVKNQIKAGKQLQCCKIVKSWKPNTASACLLKKMAYYASCESGTQGNMNTEHLFAAVIISALLLPVGRYHFPNAILTNYTANIFSFS